MDSASSEAKTYVIRLQAELAAEPERVWAALTEPEQLRRWFAEQAEVDLPAGRYSFCGNHTPDTPCQPEPLVRLADWEAGRSLSFNWNIRAADSLVRISLEAAPAATLVSIDHSGIPALGKGRVSYKDWWPIVLSNLRDHLSGARAPLLWELAPRDSSDLVFTLDVDAPPEQVWDALTRPELLTKVIDGEAGVELREGGSYHYGWGEKNGPLKILELRQGEYIKTDWYLGSDPATAIAWSLEPRAGGTRVTLVHSGFDAMEDQELGRTRADDYGSGWMHYLFRLRELCERPLGTEAGSVKVLEAPEGWQC